MAISALYVLPLRQTEGFARGLATLLGLDPDLVPDYSTLCRRRTSTPPPPLPALPAGSHVVLLIDSTGARLSGGLGWNQDKPYGQDRRRSRYAKAHIAVDAVTGLPVASEITPSSGAGSGDASVAPDLISQAADRLAIDGSRLAGGIGDGAYDADSIYQRMRARGGRWLAPTPPDAALGKHPVRDDHVVGVKRHGERYHQMLGYHQRSCVESTMGALKRTVGLASRARTIEAQSVDLQWQIYLYSLGLARTPR